MSDRKVKNTWLLVAVETPSLGHGGPTALVAKDSAACASYHGVNTEGDIQLDAEILSRNNMQRQSTSARRHFKNSGGKPSISSVAFQSPVGTHNLEIYAVFEDGDLKVHSCFESIKS
ncbi:hypothetical protein TNCV_2868561 [Trichonephila clavipes]|nr:hypothetical protein TNCV_2868561 [Trichonephila clavipes]